MSRKLVAFLALAMVCALVAADVAAPEERDGLVPLVLPVPSLRVARSPEKKKGDSCSLKSCVKGCRVVNGNAECLP